MKVHSPPTYAGGQPRRAMQSTVHSKCSADYACAFTGSWTCALLRICRGVLAVVRGLSCIRCGLWSVDRGLSCTLSVACIVTLLTLASCGSDSPEFPDTYREDVIDYFRHVALGFEFGDAAEVTRKWNTDMKLFVGGTPSQLLHDELDRIIAELNELTAADGFSISLTTDSLASNAYAYFGTSADFVKIYPAAATDVHSNLGLFYVKFDGSNHIYYAISFVDLERTPSDNARKHLLREELTQSLGLARDSYEYPASIFQQSWTTVTEYAPIDRDLIRLLYNPGMATGLDADRVAPVLEKLTVDLKIGTP